MPIYLRLIRWQDRPSAPRSPLPWPYNSWKFTRLGQVMLRRGQRCQCCHCYCSPLAAAYCSCQSLWGYCILPEADGVRDEWRHIGPQIAKAYVP
ncbi:hypothetical protein BC835DRAFT_210138 [Cytidiella melzeri]|nr:hypothetical protein BC835DRAFT_210138 [Cytidiella melzeri]